MKGKENCFLRGKTFSSIDQPIELIIICEGLVMGIVNDL
jgi:hypothetical protein